MKKSGIVYLFSLYLFLGMFLYLSTTNSEHVLGVPLILGLICIVMSVVTIISVCISIKKIRYNYELQGKLNHMMLAMKLITIPFYVINFGFWVLIAMAFMAVPGVIIFLPVVFLGVIIACLVLATTSAYSISVIYMLYRNRVFPLKKCILHGVLQVIFVVDVFDSVYLYFKNQQFLNSIRMQVDRAC